MIRELRVEPMWLLPYPDSLVQAHLLKLELRKVRSSQDRKAGIESNRSGNRSLDKKGVIT
jgi:hypothetical protein